MAKMYGSYESLDGGSIVSGLSVLTGYPCEVIHFRGKEGNESNSTVLYNTIYMHYNTIYMHVCILEGHGHFFAFIRKSH